MRGYRHVDQGHPHRRRNGFPAPSLVRRCQEAFPHGQPRHRLAFGADQALRLDVVSACFWLPIGWNHEHGIGKQDDKGLPAIGQVGGWAVQMEILRTCRIEYPSDSSGCCPCQALSTCGQGNPARGRGKLNEATRSSRREECQTGSLASEQARPGGCERCAPALTAGHTHRGTVSAHVKDPMRTGDPDVAGTCRHGRWRFGKLGRLDHAGTGAPSLSEPLFLVEQIVAGVGAAVDLGHVEEIEHVLSFLFRCDRANGQRVVVWLPATAE